MERPDLTRALVALLGPDQPEKHYSPPCREDHASLRDLLAARAGPREPGSRTPEEPK